jgi:hypothetical protein
MSNPWESRWAASLPAGPTRYVSGEPGELQSFATAAGTRPASGTAPHRGLPCRLTTERPAHHTGATSNERENT